MASNMKINPPPDTAGKSAARGPESYLLPRVVVVIGLFVFVFAAVLAAVGDGGIAEAVCFLLASVGVVVSVGVWVLIDTAGKISGP